MTNFPTIYRVIIGLRNLRDALRKKSNRSPPFSAQSMLYVLLFIIFGTEHGWTKYLSPPHIAR